MCKTTNELGLNINCIEEKYTRSLKFNKSSGTRGSVNRLFVWHACLRKCAIRVAQVPP